MIKRIRAIENTELAPEKNHAIRSASMQNKIDQKKREYGLLDYKNRKYSPDMCNTIVNLMSEGRSKYEVAYELKVSTKTIEKWEETYPEFAEAMFLGEEASRAWWERLARENIVTTKRDVKFNTTLWASMMKKRFAWEKEEEEDPKKAIRAMEQKKEEIGQLSDSEHTAKVLDIFRGIGCQAAAVDSTAKAKTD